MEVDYEQELYKHLTSFGFEVKVQDVIFGICILVVLAVLFFFSMMKLLFKSIPSYNSGELEVFPIQEIRILLFKKRNSWEICTS